MTNYDFVALTIQSMFKAFDLLSVYNSSYFTPKVFEDNVRAFSQVELISVSGMTFMAVGRMADRVTLLGRGNLNGQMLLGDRLIGDNEASSFG